ncbi:hypothetical protein GGS24DRAFT_454622 [Hypoxylon argillaceum]|nr:hypothetical protein GGS24DRAFT_454622 [Hypoxylon argillaceum]
MLRYLVLLGWVYPTSSFPRLSCVPPRYLHPGINNVVQEYGWFPAKGSASISCGPWQREGCGSLPVCRPEGWPEPRIISKIT